MAFLNVVFAITDPGDEIILQTPFYFNHEMAIEIASCRAVLVPTDENYQLQPDLIRAAITDRTRAIVTISPNNPTGAVYSESALRAVNQLCRDADCFHITDEAYEYFTYGVDHFSAASIADSANHHDFRFFSLSKAYGFASWRIGYMVIPAFLLEAMQKIQDTNVICPAVVSQFAALGALQAGRSYCEEKTFSDRGRARSCFSRTRFDSPLLHRSSSRWRVLFLTQRSYRFRFDGIRQTIDPTSRRCGAAWIHFWIKARLLSPSWLWGVRERNCDRWNPTPGDWDKGNDSNRMSDRHLYEILSSFDCHSI